MNTYKIKRFFRNFAIENLMSYVAVTMALVFVGDLFSEGMLSAFLSFNRSLILEGQIWRIVTFLFIPQTNSVIWIIFSVYFYYFIGKSVENGWGSHNMTMYFLTGYALLLIIGFATGYTDASYLYFSLFLVFAALNPHEVFMMFFVIPVEARWLALIDAIYMGYEFIDAIPYYAFPGTRVLAAGIQLSVLAGFAVYLIFFGKQYIDRFRNRRNHREFFSQMRRNKIKVTKNREDNEK